MKILIAAAAVLLVTGLRTHAQEPAKSQHVLTVPTTSGQIWNPGVYATAEKCETARKVFLRSVKPIRMTRAACAELLSP